MNIDEAKKLVGDVLEQMDGVTSVEWKQDTGSSYKLFNPVVHCGPVSYELVIVTTSPPRKDDAGKRREPGTAIVVER